MIPCLRPCGPLFLMLLSGSMMAAPRVLVHGHRGARAVLPENTIPAFEHAIEAGADFLELDLAVTQDNVLVVSHDPTMNPRICTGPESAPRAIRQMTLAQLKQWDCGAKQNPEFPKQKPAPGARVPTLEEVLALAPRGAFHFNLETKVPKDPALAPPPDEFARLLWEAVRRSGLAARVMVQSFDFRTLHAMKKLAPSMRLAALYEPGPKDFPAIAREAGVKIVSPHFSNVTEAKVRAAHAAGLEVVPWTANTAEEWDRLIACGVDAIITDDPAALIAHLRQRGLR